MRHSVAMTDECVYRRITADAAGWEFFEPTRFAIGPWDDRLQHGGPVSALLARAMDRVETPTDGRLARLTFEILRPVLMGPVGVRARLVRPGRKVSLVEAEMIQTDADGEQATVALARAWRIARSDTAAARHVPLEPLAPVTDAELDDPDMKVPALLDRGFVGGLEWVVRSPIGRRGAPTAAWARPRFGLVEGERGTALERFVMVADSANGVGMRLDPTEWTFMNTDLSIHLHAEPQGDWVGLVAESTIGETGAGTGAATLHDLRGPVGRLAQVLLVERRA